MLSSPFRIVSFDQNAHTTPRPAAPIPHVIWADAVPQPVTSAPSHPVRRRFVGRRQQQKTLGISRSLKGAEREAVKQFREALVAAGMSRTSSTIREQGYILAAVLYMAGATRPPGLSPVEHVRDMRTRDPQLFNAIMDAARRLYPQFARSPVPWQRIERWIDGKDVRQAARYISNANGEWLPDNQVRMVEDLEKWLLDGGASRYTARNYGSAVIAVFHRLNAMGVQSMDEGGRPSPAAQAVVKSMEKYARIAWSRLCDYLKTVSPATSNAAPNTDATPVLPSFRELVAQLGLEPAPQNVPPSLPPFSTFARTAHAGEVARAYQDRLPTTHPAKRRRI